MTYGCDLNNGATLTPEQNNIREQVLLGRRSKPTERVSLYWMFAFIKYK